MSLRLVRSPFAPKMVMVAESGFLFVLIRANLGFFPNTTKPAQKLSRLRYLIGKQCLLGFPDIVAPVAIGIAFIRIDSHPGNRTGRRIMEFPDRTVHPYFDRQLDPVSLA